MTKDIPNKWTIGIISPAEKEKLVAEISYDNECWAEISQDKGFFEIEVFSREGDESWKFNYDDLCEALLEARNKLNKVVSGESKFFPKRSS